MSDFKKHDKGAEEMSEADWRSRFPVGSKFVYPTDLPSGSRCTYEVLGYIDDALNTDGGIFKSLHAARMEPISSTQPGYVFRKDDSSKPKMGTLPWEALKKVREVMDFGADKYGEDNWRKADSSDRYIQAAFRHLIAHQQGELLDSESGKEHLAHAATSLLFALELTK